MSPLPHCRIYNLQLVLKSLREIQSLSPLILSLLPILDSPKLPLHRTMQLLTFQLMIPSRTFHRPTPAPVGLDQPILHPLLRPLPHFLPLPLHLQHRVVKTTLQLGMNQPIHHPHPSYLAVPVNYLIQLTSILLLWLVVTFPILLAMILLR